METSTLADRVYEILKGRILQHDYANGQKLNIAALASDLDVSNTPIREAISRLEKVGLVKTVPYRGPYVRSLSPAEAAGVFDVRIALEGLAARLAAASAQDSDIAEIETLHQTMQSALAQADFEHALDLDVRFHQVIARAANNTTLFNLLQMLADWTRLFMQFGLPTPRPPNLVVSEHGQILDAIRAGDVDQASRAMQKHILAARHDLISHLVEQDQQAEASPQIADYPNVWEQDDSDDHLLHA